VPTGCSPFAALDASDLPAMLDYVIDAAISGGHGAFWSSVPLTNHVAVAHLLARGAPRIDPFLTTVLASDNSMKLDRWIHTIPSFIL